MSPYRLAVIGLGPRAISLLEWLTLRVEENIPPIAVTFIDDYPVGGRVWQADQPLELLMNTLAGESTVLADVTVGSDDPGPTLWSWTRIPGILEGLPAPLRKIAEDLKPSSYAPRALFGHYLQWAFTDLVERSRGRLEIKVIQDRVVALTDMPDGIQRLTLASHGDVEASSVVLALGHLPVEQSAGEVALGDAAKRFGGLYSPASHPLDVPVSNIGDQESVIVRGLSLNFFDILAMLTEGRGGKFQSGPDGLDYKPSGHEPRIYAGTRRGVPPYARVDSPELRAPVRFLNEAFLSAVLSDAPDVTLQEVWPAVVREVTWAYYAALHVSQPTAIHGSAEDFLRELTVTPVESPQWLDMLERRVPDPAHRLDLRQLGRPLGGRIFDDPPSLQEWMLKHLDADSSSAMNPLHSPRAAVAAALRDCRSRIAPLLGAGGVSGKSFIEDVEGWFAPLVGLIANGPPVLRIQQLAALARAGIVTFLGEGIAVTADEDSFAACSASLPANRYRARVLIDCYVPKQDVRRSVDPLLACLFTTGALRPHTREGGPGQTREIGAVDVDGKAARMISKDGEIHPSRFVLGIPLEGVRWNTPLAGRAGVNSAFFHDTRAVAEAVVEHANSHSLMSAFE